MRVQCDVCESAPASVMCCADEAVLCADCDTRVHAANKLANKHQRVPLIVARQSPSCDICQEKSAFFFCLEDRALLCRECDVSIHSATALSSAHQRFLVPGTRVALEALSGNHESVETYSVEECSRHPLSSIISSSSVVNSPSTISNPSTTIHSSSINSKPAYNSSYRPAQSLTPSSMSTAPPKSSAVPSRLTGMNSSTSQITHSTGGHGSHSIPSSLARRTSITEFLSDVIPNWRVDELLNIPDMADGYNLGDIGSSKADVSNMGEYDWTADLSLFDEQVYAESFHEVPQMPSPPTASGIVGRSGRGVRILKGKAKQESIVPEYDDAFVVPDLGLDSAPASPPMPKRRRPFIQV